MLICQITDLHLRPRGMPAYRVSETNALTERAIDAVAALAPAPGRRRDHRRPDRLRARRGIRASADAAAAARHAGLT